MVVSPSEDSYCFAGYNQDPSWFEESGLNIQWSSIQWRGKSCMHRQDVKVTAGANLFEVWPDIFVQVYNKPSERIRENSNSQQRSRKVAIDSRLQKLNTCHRAWSYYTRLKFLQRKIGFLDPDFEITEAILEEISVKCALTLTTLSRDMSQNDSPMSPSFRHNYSHGSLMMYIKLFRKQQPPTINLDSIGFFFSKMLEKTGKHCSELLEDTRLTGEKLKEKNPLEAGFDFYFASQCPLISGGLSEIGFWESLRSFRTAH
ncbi:hypothetical protein MAR_037536 [Mya arenaria]|uniref:Uncharacterized protein n=1 Tax=Mya arenaria TaxID=6604 RepID=A0ABY7FQJ2_MYAAR|nr:hypothetical protein MAR_037536 [Mya arenaria]